MLALHFLAIGAQITAPALLDRKCAAVGCITGIWSMQLNVVNTGSAQYETGK